MRDDEQLDVVRKDPLRELEVAECAAKIRKIERADRIDAIEKYGFATARILGSLGAATVGGLELLQPALIAAAIDPISAFGISLVLAGGRKAVEVLGAGLDEIRGKSEQ